VIDLPLTSPERAAQYRKLGLWRDVTFHERFAAAARRHPGKMAIIEEVRRFTYGELAQAVENVAGNLLELGLAAGDVVALQVKNSAELPLVHLACNRIGLLFMPLHDSWREHEIGHLLRKSRARAVITPIVYRDFDHAGMIGKLRPELPDLAHVFTLDGAAPGARAFTDLLRPSARSAAELDARRPDPDAPAHIMLSGGTTALSKMSRFSCNDLLVMLTNFADAAELVEDDIAAALAPAGTGATGYVFPILAPLLWGATSVILERWSDPADAIDLILGHHCTYAVGIPTQLTRMIPVLETHDMAEFSRFRLFFNSGAPLPHDTGLKIEKLMGCVVQSMYGSTDGGVPTTTRVSDPQEKRLGTVGRVVPGSECVLWDAEGKPVPVGQDGEVVWRGADKSWGYLADDEQTAKTFTDDHFYRSGDLGRFDADGYLRIVGRLKDMILRGGRNISPLTIEERLIKHPSVVDVAVAPMPDPELGERACAFVLLRSGAQLTLPEAVEFLKSEGLAVWQLPERLVVIDSFPRGPGGKVLKAKLTEAITAKLAEERKVQA
jgi:non-ribosomal peptide synthetase component E (peptide arylation enzyme)